MSSSGGKRPFYPSPLALLLLISLLHTWVASQSSRVEAIRIFPKVFVAVEEEGQPIEAAPPGKNQTEIFREYFRTRLSDLNSTTNDTFQDDKRKIPSCPDPLHN